MAFNLFTGQPERSELTALEALKFLPREANLHFSLAGILGKQNRFEESEKQKSREKLVIENIWVKVIFRVRERQT